MIEHTPEFIEKYKSILNDRKGWVSDDSEYLETKNLMNDGVVVTASYCNNGNGFTVMCRKWEREGAIEDMHTHVFYTKGHSVIPYPVSGFEEELNALGHHCFHVQEQAVKEETLRRGRYLEQVRGKEAVEKQKEYERFVGKPVAPPSRVVSEGISKSAIIQLSVLCFVLVTIILIGSLF